MFACTLPSAASCVQFLCGIGISVSACEYDLRHRHEAWVAFLILFWTAVLACVKRSGIPLAVVVEGLSHWLLRFEP